MQGVKRCDRCDKLRMVRLSIIDQSPVPDGFTPADALRNTIELARLADRLGYERYWIAEHHSTRAFASPAPEILISRVAAETAHIRVGSGGVMLPHYSPLKVAETFRMLHALYPDRIDLGIGRAPGGTPLDTFALRRDRKGAFPDDFPQQLTELMAFLNDDFPEDHPFRRILVSPALPGAPEIWLLGSSLWSAAAAAQLDLPYAFASFIDSSHTRKAIEYYHSHLKNPAVAERTILAVGAICAETSEEAHRLFASVRLWVRRIRTGGGGAIPRPDEAVQELGTTTDRPLDEDADLPRIFVGDPEQLHIRLTTLADELRVKEIMVVTIVHDHQARMRSYELLAKAFELKPRSE